MKNNKREIAIRIGQLLPNMTSRDISDLMTKLKSLAKAHHRQCENLCNLEGYVGRKYYGFCHRDGQRDVDYYLDDTKEKTVFDVELERIERALSKVTASKSMKIYDLEFQHDPIGATVKINIGGLVFCPTFDF